MMFLTFAMNITQVGFESFFPRKLSATNRAFLFDSCRLFLHRVNSHHYLCHHQYTRGEPVRRDRIMLCASLETAMGQASGFSLLKGPRDHARDRKQRKLRSIFVSGQPSSISICRTRLPLFLGNRARNR